MKKLLNVLTGLCLLAGAFTGCDKPNEDEDGGGTPRIRIRNRNNSLPFKEK